MVKTLNWFCLKTQRNHRSDNEQRDDKTIKTKECFTFEEALDETGNLFDNLIIIITVAEKIGFSLG